MNWFYGEVSPSFIPCSSFCLLRFTVKVYSLINKNWIGMLYMCTVIMSIRSRLNFRFCLYSGHEPWNEIFFPTAHSLERGRFFTFVTDSSRCFSDLGESRSSEEVLVVGFIDPNFCMDTRMADVGTNVFTSTSYSPSSTLLCISNNGQRSVPNSSRLCEFIGLVK